MEDYERVGHTRWQCKYHIVFIPKYQKRQLYGVGEEELGEVICRYIREQEAEDQ